MLDVKNVKIEVKLQDVTSSVTWRSCKSAAKVSFIANEKQKVYDPS